jgi:tRNA(Arg) A34 adenosine deaminase TadA|tara:strand:+ start:982 stop:1428 length:447 start_codon:yes stop_codon:yes gene_type:complete
MISDKSKDLMTRVLKLAEVNLTNNKIPIAALVASKDGDDVICEAVNNDGPLEHAELIALSEAMRLLNKKRLNEYVLFTNLEPCPMCAYAISKCNIDTLYFGAEDVKGGGVVNGARISFSENMFKPNIISGLFEEESTKLLKSFFKAKR